MRGVHTEGMNQTFPKVAQFGKGTRQKVILVCIGQKFVCYESIYINIHITQASFQSQKSDQNDYLLKAKIVED